MKTILCLIVYLVFLLPAFLVALNKAVDLMDQGTGQPSPSFWRTGFGEGLLFGLPFVVAALTLWAFLFVLRRLWRFVPA